MNIKNLLSKINSKLNSNEKVALLGSIICIVSAFLPWYRDLDAWGKGEVYLGVTGPLSIIGISIFVLSGMLAMQLIGRTFNNDIQILNKIEGLRAKVGLQNLFLLIIATSIYIDANFGVNLTLKETSIGLFMSFIGSALIAISGFASLGDSAPLTINDVFDEVEAGIERAHTGLAEKTQAEIEYERLARSEDALYKEEEDETLKMNL